MGTHAPSTPHSTLLHCSATPTSYSSSHLPLPAPTMAMSGVQLAEGCMDAYNDIQKAKKHLYATFFIEDGKIKVETLGQKGRTYSDFLTDLMKKDGPKDDCRFAVYDYEYQFAPEGADAQAKSKIFLLCWCPDTSAIKKKMLYSASFDTLKRAFVGVHKVIQANDESDIQQDEIENYLRATDRN